MKLIECQRKTIYIKDVAFFRLRDVLKAQEVIMCLSASLAEYEQAGRVRFIFCEYLR